ncbi:MAG: TonB family protein [Bacteroidales bacterium]|nr:TonB family protein [Bacteroidales bacterium]
MNRILPALLSLAIPVIASAQYQGYDELYESETASSMRQQVEYLASSALEGRKAGSEGELEAARYIADRLESYDVDVLSGTDGTLFGICEESEDTLVSRNVIGYIQGYDKKLRDKYIVIGARLDNLGSRMVGVDGVNREMVFSGANGNASGLSLMLQLARIMSTNRVLLRRSVLFVAFGAAELDNAGSWYFLNRYFKDRNDIDAMVNLDMVGTGSRGFYAYTASNPDLNNMLNALEGTLQPVLPQIVSMEPVRSDHRSFYQCSIPSVFFTTGMYPEYNTDRDTPSVIEYDWMERILEYVYNFTLSLVNGAKPEFDASAEKKKKPVLQSDVVAYNECETPPAFLGSYDPTVFLKKWVYVYLKYPQEAVENGIQGKVLVSFIIDEKGKMRDVEVTKGVHPLLDEAAVRAVSASPDWRPARRLGKKVKCSMSLYVEFRLQRKK